MKILNLHGFMGEADNKNYKALCSMIAPENIISPQLKYMETSPEKLLKQLTDMVCSDDLIFVGQSLGGWYADKLSRKFRRPCILTNPCNYPHKLELITSSGIPADFVKQYEKMSSADMNLLAYVICSTEDTILPDNYHDCTELFSPIKLVHGSHSTIENLHEHLAEMLEKVTHIAL